MKFKGFVVFILMGLSAVSQNWQPVKHGLYNNVNHDSSFYIGQTLRITDTLNLSQNIYKLNMGVVEIPNSNGNLLIVRGFIGDSVQLANNFSIIYRDSFLYRLPQTINVGDTVLNNVQDSSTVFLESQQNQLVWDTVWQDVRTYVYSFRDTVWVTKNLGIFKVNLGGEKYFTVGTEGLLITGRKRFPDYGLLKDAELCLSNGDYNSGVLQGTRFRSFLKVDSVTDLDSGKFVHGVNYWEELGLIVLNPIDMDWGDTSRYFHAQFNAQELKDEIFPNEAIYTFSFNLCYGGMVPHPSVVFTYKTITGQHFKLTANEALFNKENDTLDYFTSFYGVNYFPDLGLFDWDCSFFEVAIYNKIEGYILDTVHVGYTGYRYLVYIGVDENKADNILIYPNPANNELRISTTLSRMSYSVVNQMGVTVLSGEISENDTINTSGLTEGVYILQIEADGALYRKMIIVRH